MKGVTPFLATVLLIIATVSLAVIVSSWYATTVRDQTKTIGNNTEQSVDCTFVKTSIQDVYMDFANNRSRVSVLNTGQKDDQLIAAKLFNSFAEESTLLTTLPADLKKGSSVSIEFNIINTIPACQNFSKVIVTTKCTKQEFTGSPKGC